MASLAVRIFVCVIVGLCLAMDAAACRYSVREVGFVDLDAAPYQVYLHLPDSLDAGTAAALRRAAQIELLNTPVVIAEENGTGPMARAIVTHAVPPGGVLIVSPEDQKTTLAPPDGVDPESYYRDRFQALIASETRSAIIDALDAFCQVLLIEGPEATANAVARTSAEAAIAEITANMDKMDKPVARTAELLTLAPEDQAREATLLWSLGLRPADITGPRIAILFGRARRLGGVLHGDKVTVPELVRVMALAGTSCECGLERKWMQGPMILMRWDRGLQQRVADHLGFDPESPTVKTEISQILAKGGSGPNAGRRLNTMLAYTEHRGDAGEAFAEGEAFIEDVPLGDGPIMAASAETPVAPAEDALAQGTVAPVAVPPSDARLVENETPAVRRGVFGLTWAAVAVIVVVNAALLLIIVFRSRRA